MAGFAGRKYKLQGGKRLQRTLLLDTILTADCQSEASEQAAHPDAHSWRCRAGLATLNNCTFAGNIASGNGAAVFQEGTPGALTRCTLANGKAQVSALSALIIDESI